MEAVIFCGIQGSGKSSFYKERFFDTHVRISQDLLRTRHRQQLFLDACLSTGQRFVVDRTNATVEERRRFIAPAIEAGFRVVGYFFADTPREALARNARREGRARIAVPAVLGTYARMQPPTRDEGFDELYIVRLGDDGFATVLTA